MDVIRQEHFNAAEANIRDADIKKAFEDEVDADCEWLRNFLFASQVIDEISPRARDSIVGLGERLACKYMTAVLRDQGIDAEYVSLEDIVPEMDDDTFTGSLDQAFYDRLSVAVGERIRACGARVPIVTGMFSLSLLVSLINILHKASLDQSPAHFSPK